MHNEPKLSPPDSEKWPYPEELWSYSEHPFIAGFYRNNRFRSTSTPIRGLTSSLMIQLAMVVYDRRPSFQAFAEGAVPTAQVINKILDEAKAEALLPPYLRVPASTPGMGMSRTTTPLPSLPGEPQGPGSPSTNVKGGGEAGDTISVMHASQKYHHRRLEAIGSLSPSSPRNGRNNSNNIPSVQSHSGDLIGIIGHHLLIHTPRARLEDLGEFRIRMPRDQNGSQIG